MNNKLKFINLYIKYTVGKIDRDKYKNIFKFIIKLAIFLLIVAIIAHFGMKAYKHIEKEYIYPIKYSEYIEKYAEQNELDKSLVYAVVKCESGFDSGAVSDIGAKGLMQLTDDTYEWVLSKTTKSPFYADDLLVPEKNIQAGCALLKLHLDEFSDEGCSLAAYHAGRSKVKEWLRDENYSSDGVTLTKIPYSDTASYVTKVLDTKQKYQDIYNFD